MSDTRTLAKTLAEQLHAEVGFDPTLRDQAVTVERAATIIKSALLAAHAESARAAQQWQPFDAPPPGSIGATLLVPWDGTTVLLAWTDFEIGASVLYDVGFWHSGEKRWCDTHQVLHNAKSFPTHWMPLHSPLPEPPQ